MKTKLLLVSLITCLNTMAQSPVCFTTPDGTTSNWSYKDYVIPAGYRIDSVRMDATRPGYTAQDFDFVFESCQGTTTFNNTIGTYPFDYNTDNNSEYNVWINLTSFNYVSTGMVRVSLPTNAGAVWNQLCFAISPVIAQTTTCFTTPDGTASNWSYKDYVIPSGYKLDSVFMDATRPGYPTQNFDFVLESCQGTATYNNSIGTYPFDYNTDNNSEYGVWINLTSFNYISVGMVRVSLPTNAGAVWNNLCLAISHQTSTGINQSIDFTDINIYPNPSNGSFTLELQKSIENGGITIYDCVGKEVFRQNISQGKNLIESTKLSKGIYFYSVIENKYKIKTGKLIID